MVSTELLRRYPFFAHLDDDQLRQLAMICRQLAFKAGDIVFVEGERANQLYLLRDGTVELHYVIKDERGMEVPQEHLVGVINPGEVFGISAVISPYLYTASAVAAATSDTIALDADALRALGDSDLRLGALLQERIAGAAFKRLQDTRVQLLAV